MKKSTYLVVLLLCLVGGSLGCNQSFEKQGIDDISSEVSIINTASNFREITLNAEDFLKHQPDGGAKLNGFYEAGSIRKISLWLGLSHGFETKDYYFKNGKLIFVHEQFNSFVYDTARVTFSRSKTEKTFNGIYFFKNEKLLHYETTGHNRFEDDTIDPEISLRTEATDYVSLLSSNL